MSVRTEGCNTSPYFILLKKCYEVLSEFSPITRCNVPCSLIVNYGIALDCETYVHQLLLNTTELGRLQRIRR